ncbi:unnamed protein product [Heligmosomoides polygyrus]|uniref:Zinc metalloproteinase n=1 Tax=Heligmosomoides polygyrus TaxID=6339 RepID=A0A183FV17_HELPZ|nr:unnamed protein product [Heligmosomoides polygyrus]
MELSKEYIRGLLLLDLLLKDFDVHQLEVDEDGVVKNPQWIPLKRDHIQPDGDSINEINLKNHIGELLYQGDIALTTTQADEIAEDIEEVEGNRTKRQAFRDRNYPKSLWEQGVFFFFDSSASMEVRSAFRKGAQAWQKDTCIDFKEVYTSSSAPNSIRVFKENGCWSYVGKTGEPVQDLSLGDGCESVGTAAHELGHALGLFHTQSRYDRDSYITVNVQNIKPDWVDQFTKQTILTNDNYGITYDPGSIMHYPAMSATFNGKPSMLPADMKYVETLGSPIISYYDLLMLNKHYGCLKNCDGKPNLCKNGGFQHPRNCMKCICPSGYGGDHCDKRPPGCGEELVAETTPKVLKNTLGTKAYGIKLREDFVFCNYWIKAPEGSKIEVKIKSFTKGVSVDGCAYAAVEIKTNKDQLLTGYRFCSDEDAGVVLTSSSNLVPVIMYNRVYETTTELEYRIVSSGVTVPRPQPVVVKPVSPYTHTTSACEDKSWCPIRRIANYCRNPAYSESLKRAACAKSCGYCR